MLPLAVDPRPGAAAFSRRCRGRGDGLVAPASTDPVRAELARQWLVLRLLRRRKWSLHRHVHLVAAFEDAASRAPVRSVLSVGCGSGLAELMLAVSHPDVTFTLSDNRPAELTEARATARWFGLTNVTIREVDLLDPDPVAIGAHDLVVSVEVLEHIEDDARALQTMFDLSRRFVWALVPFSDERQLADPRVCRAAWERHEHVRPGYSHATLAERFAPATTLWQRNCYFLPEATDLRSRMTGSRLRRMYVEQVALFDRAVRDVQGRRVDDGREAAGIEILVSLDPGDRPGPLT